MSNSQTAEVDVTVAAELRAQLETKIARGAKLSREIKSLEAKKAELDELKAEFRELAGAKDLRMEAASGASVSVDQKGKATMRVVADDQLSNVRRLAGDQLFELFTLHPSKGDAKNFELNVRQSLPKRAAQALLRALTVDATAWVTFRD